MAGWLNAAHLEVGGHRAPAPCSTAFRTFPPGVFLVHALPSQRRDLGEALQIHSTSLRLRQP
ncbi:hypothetical protein MPC1_1120003 [Methylocella tundrae]|nr:hypothetical protein MPC1_1120003 [Methylocella tundrae]